MDENIPDLTKYEFYLQQYRTCKIRNNLTYRDWTKKTRNKLRQLLHGKREIFNKKRHRYYYMNPAPIISLIETILRAAAAFNFSKQKTHAFTVLHRSWHTTLKELEDNFDEYFNLRAIRGRIYNALQGKDYFGFIELAFLENDVIATHFHGVSWSEISDADKKRINACFEGGEDKNQPGFNTSLVKDMIKVFSYLVKPPVTRYVKPSNDKKKKHVRLSKKKATRLARLMKKHDVTYFDLMVAAGEGKRFKRAIERYLMTRQ